MKTVLIMTLLVLSLTGCERLAESSTPAGKGFVVEKLFTHEGCTVYRFADSGRSRYFTNCNGTTSWVESCGKGCVRDAGID